jgi:cytidyltransferase-like protein
MGIRVFQKARLLGDHLPVFIVPDGRISKYKGRDPVFTTEQRMEVVAACRWVDEVTDSGPITITQSFMNENDFQIYAFGASDSTERAVRLSLCEDLPRSMIVEIPYTPEISSSSSRRKLAQKT